MAEVLDRVDAKLPGLTSMNWRYSHGPLAKEMEDRDDIMRRFWEVVGDDEDQSATEVFREALSAPEGTVPSLARPGCWLEWVGYIPVLVYWGGFTGEGNSIQMADPAEKWINSTGYESIYINLSRGDADLRAIFREELVSRTRAKKFALQDVDADTRQEVAANLEAKEWLRAALKAGAVNPIAMPPKFKAVQLLPFA
jgi:hypothetical protein